MSVERLLAQAFAQSHPLEAAQALERLPDAERSGVVERLPLREAIAVLKQMEMSMTATTLARRSARGVADVLAALPAQIAARLLERLEAAKRRETLAHLPADVASALQRLLRHAQDTAGALMDSRVTAYPRDITVGEARRRILRRPRDLLYYVYVVDRDDRLVGAVNLRELMQASRAALLASVMQTEVQSLSTRATRAAILAHPGWLDFHALPVVDRGGVLAGVLRYDTLRQLEAAQAGEESPGLLPIGLALGEIYWSAATALLHGVFDTVQAAGESEQGGGADAGG